MSAFDDFTNAIQNKKVQLTNFRKELVSGNGNLVNGKIPLFMNLKTRAQELTDVDGNTIVKEIPRRLYIRTAESDTEDFGFVFDSEGTKRAIEVISNGQKLRVYDDFADKLRFIDERRQTIWHEQPASMQKNLIADDIMRMVKKTDLQYRIHGDRLHYFVLGRITTVDSSLTRSDGETKHYPLLLFSCVDTDKIKMSIDVEQTGFVNFWLDENVLDKTLSKKFGGLEVNMGEDLIRNLIGLQNDFGKLKFSQFESVELDPTFSMIGVVTGFEAEYIDKAWEAIIND